MFNFFDLLYAALFSLVLTFTTLKISKFIKIANLDEFNLNALDIDKIQNNCYRYFPEDTVYFDGRAFKRGMFVKVHTYSEKDFEGLLIGSSKEDVICILTLDYVVAYKLEGIREITMAAE
ncbi:MAG: hypothetical protein LBV08_09420 [Clostridiales bacterium]|jgi:hypothetical protein|nr:hypothetical protein [Clostridiales bacterium]